MPKVVFICLLAISFCFAARAQDVITVTKTTARSYNGNIGQKPVHMNLSITNGKVTGEFVYEHVGVPIDLSGTLLENKLNLVASPRANYPVAVAPNDDYVKKGSFSGTISEIGGLSGSFRMQGNSSNLDVYLEQIFEVDYIDTALKAAYINHNPDFKTDTVYTLSLQELNFLNLTYRKNFRNIKYWYSFPLVSIMDKGNYADLNSVGGVKLEELGYIDGDYLLQQRKTVKHPQYPYHFLNAYLVAYIDNRFLSVRSDKYLFDGSPHAFTSQIYKNYDLLTGDSLKLDSLFLQGGKYYLDSVGEICFRKQLGLSPNTDLYTAGYYWNDSSFHVNANFYFTVSGICFVYNTYEIGAYTMGVTKFIIPYEMLKPIIRRKGPLGWVRNE